MNTSDAPKYSIDALPGDSWEVRRTKEIARAILKAKNSRKLTTEQLAKRCSQFLGETDAVKTSTLNGLFAGKRRSISTTELEMFADVMSVSVLELLYPVGEGVEPRPGKPMQSSDALGSGLKVFIDLGNVRLFDRNRDIAVLDFLGHAFSVEGHTARTIYDLHKWGPDFSKTKLDLEQLKWSAMSLRSSKTFLESRGETIPTIDATSSWVLDLDENSVNSLTPELVFSIEPLYRGKGHSIGDYLLGGADVEHKEEA